MQSPVRQWSRRKVCCLLWCLLLSQIMLYSNIFKNWIVWMPDTKRLTTSILQSPIYTGSISQKKLRETPCQRYWTNRQDQTDMKIQSLCQKNKGWSFYFQSAFNTCRYGTYRKKRKNTICCKSFRNPLFWKKP